MHTADAIRIEPDPTESSLVILHLSGRVSIEMVTDLHFAGEELLTRGQDVRIDCSGAEELDLAAIQLLIALAMDLNNRGRECRVVGVPAETGNLMRHAGL